MFSKLSPHIQGYVWSLISSFCFASTWAIAKFLPYDGTELAFWRNFIGLLFLIPWLLLAKPKQVGSAPFTLFFRGLIGSIALVLFFVNVKQIPLGDAITIGKTEPFFTAILAFYLIKEKLSKSTFFAITVGFIGVICICSSHAPYNIFFIVIGLISALFAAMAYITLRNLRNLYDPRIASFSFMGIGVIFTTILFFTPLSNGFILPHNIIELSLVVMLGIGGLFGQISLTKAYYLAPAAQISTIGYATILFGVILDFLIDQTMPSIFSIAGMFFIVFGGILIVRK